MLSSPQRSRAAVVLCLLTAGAGLAGCAPTVNVEPAADAANPKCAEIMVRLPDQVAAADRRETDSQATAAWGNPSLVVLRCGVPVPAPTTDRCVSVNDVDWVIEEGEEAWTLTTYGRDPATEVLFDPNQVASSTVLVDLGGAVSQIPQENECLSLTDVELPEGSY